MALLWIDGFDKYGTSIGAAPSPAGIVGKKYTHIAQESSIDVQTGRFSNSYGLKLNGYYNATRLGMDNLTTDRTVTLGFAMKTAQFDETDCRFVALTYGGTYGISLYWGSSTAYFAVYRGSTQIGSQFLHTMSAGTWHYVELKCYCDNTAGTVEVRVDGTTLFTFNGDTQNGTTNYHDGFRFMSYNSAEANTFIIDDLYFLDSTGSNNNNFLGPCRVWTSSPNANGDTQDWDVVPANSAHYSVVDEAICDEDSEYVESNVNGEYDLWGVADCPSEISTIRGVQISTDARVTDTTPFNLYQVCKSNATLYDGSAISIGSTNFVTKTRMLEVDPATSSLWTPTNFASAQFGVKVGT